MMKCDCLPGMHKMSCPNAPAKMNGPENDAYNEGRRKGIDFAIQAMAELFAMQRWHINTKDFVSLLLEKLDEEKKK